MENGVETQGRNDTLKLHQKPLTVPEQIENLKNIGLVIDDEAAAEDILEKVTYFRLIKAYGMGLKPKNSNFDGSVKFEDIVALYDFNSEFRQTLIGQIEKIEITLRCQLANFLCCKYGILGYVDSANFANETNHKDIMAEIYSSIGFNRRSPFIKNFQKNYQGHDIPLYALVEILSFGTISKLFKNMHNADKKTVAGYYGVNWPYLESWFESLAYVRNICAHYGRLYYIRLDKTPKLPKDGKLAGVPNQKIFGVLYCMAKLLPRNDGWSDFLDGIERLFAKYPQAKKEKMGFLENWRSLLEPQAN